MSDAVYMYLCRHLIIEPYMNAEELFLSDICLEEIERLGMNWWKSWSYPISIAYVVRSVVRSVVLRSGHMHLFDSRATPKSNVMVKE